MYNEVFWLYLLTRLDAINGVLVVSSIIGSITLGLGIVFSFDEYSQKFSQKILSYKWIIIAFMTLSLLIPTKNQMLFIISGTGLLEIAKSDEAHRIGGKSVQVFERYLDELLKDEKK